MNGKRHGKGKEYNFGSLRLEGEFSNGYLIKGKRYDNKGNLEFVLERNGKGIEYYDDGNIKYEGKYLNEKKNGKVKYYNTNGKLELEGEYKDDVLNGKVKEYDENGKLEFEGEYNNGKKWKGKENSQIFQGEYLNGKRWNGKGREYKSVYVGPGCTDFVRLISFEGDYINGKRKGKGEIYDRKSRRRILKEIDEENNIKTGNEDN